MSRPNPNLVSRNTVLVGGLMSSQDPTDGHTRKQIAKVTYDFALDGGAVGTINLGDRVFTRIPDNAVISTAYVDVLTTLTSSGDIATIALQAEAANDIVLAVAIGTGTPWDAGQRAGIPDGTAANMVKTTAERQLKMVIGVEAVTAGKFVLVVEYDVTA